LAAAFFLVEEDFFLVEPAFLALVEEDFFFLLAEAVVPVDFLVGAFFLVADGFLVVDFFLVPVLGAVVEADGDLLRERDLPLDLVTLGFTLNDWPSWTKTPVSTPFLKAVLKAVGLTAPKLSSKYFLIVALLTGRPLLWILCKADTICCKYEPLLDEEEEPDEAALALGLVDLALVEADFFGLVEEDFFDGDLAGDAVLGAIFDIYR